MNSNKVSQKMHFEALQFHSARFLNGLQGEQPWTYRFSSTNEPNLIGNSLAVMLAGLLGKVDQMSEQDKQPWADKINACQQPSGFYSDDDICEENLMTGYTKERALFHRTRHALFAMNTLGVKPRYRFEFLEDMLSKPAVEKWMKGLNLKDYWDASNKMMDLCIFLEHEAKAFQNKTASKIIHMVLDICDENTNPKTGYHDRGESDLRNAMAGAMHIYPIYFVWRRQPKYPERVIDATLSLQQSDGLFSYDVGTGGEDCLDYDAVNILVNFTHITDYRRNDIKTCLTKVLDALHLCKNQDGGYCCHRRSKPYQFGTRTTEVPIGGSSLWSTYARLLTIAMATQVLTDHPSAGSWVLGNNLMEVCKGPYLVGQL